VTNEFSLADVINMGFRANIMNTHTCLPGEIQSYDSVKLTCSVRLGISPVIDDQPEEYPIISGVPVVFPRTKNGGITFPLSAGDSALIVFSERNLDQWRTFGPGQPPLDGRIFDINDAIAIPGFFPDKGVPIPPLQNSTEVRGEKIFLGNPLGVMTPVTSVPSGAPGTGPTVPVTVLPGYLDLLKIIEYMLDIIGGANYGTPASGGPIDPKSLLVVQSLKADLAKLQV